MYLYHSPEKKRKTKNTKHKKPSAANKLSSISSASYYKSSADTIMWRPSRHGKKKNRNGNGNGIA